MADLVAAAASRAGIPLWLMRALVGQESGGRQSAVSYKGAYGMAQLMPGTARRLEQTYGINTRTAAGNLLGGAYYLKEQLDRFGSIPLALAAYNAGPGAVSKYGGIPPYRETQNYVRSIMSRQGADAGSGSPLFPPATGTSLQPPAPLSPSYTKQDVLEEMRQSLARGTYNPLTTLASLRRAAEATASASQSTAGYNIGSAAFPAYTTAGKNWGKWVTLGKGADRGGMSTQPAVLAFVAGLGKMAGQRLTIGTGTNHSRMTVNGNVSQHWSGMAADIPSSGSALLRLGRLALMEAGMPRAQAMKAGGGLYNVGRYQIIFLTNEGGNHYNHLHIGV